MKKRNFSIWILLVFQTFWSCSPKSSMPNNSLFLVLTNSRQTPQSQTPVVPNTNVNSPPIPTCLSTTCGASGVPTASFGFSATAVDRYRNLPIVFNASMNNATALQNVNIVLYQLPSLTVEPIGNLIWTSPQNIAIDPTNVLAAGTSYRLDILPTLVTNSGTALTSFSQTFTTEISFNFSHTLAGLDPGSDPFSPSLGGLNIDNTLYSSSLMLSTNITPIAAVGQIKSVLLCRLGDVDFVTGDLCGPDGSRGLTLCANAPCPGTYNTNILPRTVLGGNIFFYVVTTLNDKKIYRTVNFNFGPLAPDSAKAPLVRRTNSNPTTIGNTLLSNITNTTPILPGMIIYGHSNIPKEATVVSKTVSSVTMSSGALGTIPAGTQITFQPTRVQNVAKLILDKQPTGPAEAKSAVKALETLIQNYAQGQFTLTGQTLLQFVTSNPSTTAPSTDSRGNACLPWTRIRNFNVTNSSSTILLSNSSSSTNGLVTGMSVSGASIPGGTTIVSVGSNSITLSATPTGNVANTPITMSWASVANYRPSYLTRIGPFCGLKVTGTLIGPWNPYTSQPIRYAALADIYITDLVIPTTDGTANPLTNQNISISLNPRTGKLDVDLYGKKASGRMALIARIPQASATGCTTVSGSSTVTCSTLPSNVIPGMLISGTSNIPANTFVAQVLSSTQFTMNDGKTSPTPVNATGSGSAITLQLNGIEFFDYLVNDTFIFNGTSVVGPDGDSLPFAMNEDPVPVTTLRRSFVRTDIDVPLADGNVRLVTNPDVFPSPFNPATNCLTLPASPVPLVYAFDCNPFSTEWSNAIVPANLTGTNAISAIIADVVNQKIPEVKPQIVQGVIRDIATNVAPNIVNNVLGQISSGTNIDLPDYLPAPLDRLRVFLSLKLAPTTSGGMVSQQVGANQGLESSADLSIVGCVKDSATVRCNSTSGSPNLTGCACSGGATCSALTDFTAGMTLNAPAIVPPNLLILSTTSSTITLNGTTSFTSTAQNFVAGNALVQCNTNGSATMSSCVCLSGCVNITDIPANSRILSGNILPSNTAINTVGGTMTLASNAVATSSNQFYTVNTNRCPGDPGYITPASIPPTPQVNVGTGVLDSYVRAKNPSVILPSQINLSSANPGAIVSLHPDGINQAIYHLWRAGALNLTIDKDFINKVNNFAGSSSLLRLTTSLLKADTILGVFAPGATNLNTNGEPIFGGDDVILQLNPRITPYVGIAPMSGATAQNPRATLVFEDLVVTVRARCSDPGRFTSASVPRPTWLPLVPPAVNTCDTGGSQYNMMTVKVSLRTAADLSFGTYTLPPNGDPLGNPFSASLIASQGNPSLQLAISSSVSDLFWIVEPLEGPTNNPLGLNPDGIWQVLNPLVTSLILPLLNNVTRSIPVPKIRACGLDISNINPIPLDPAFFSDPFLLLRADVTNYSFTSDCQL